MQVDHEEARKIAETFLATPDHVDEDAMDKLPAAYLDLREKAEAYLHETSGIQWVAGHCATCDTAIALLAALAEKGPTDGK